MPWKTDDLARSRGVSSIETSTKAGRRHSRLEMTMEEDDVLCTSPSPNDDTYIADLLREVEIKIGPIPPSLLPAALGGPRNFQDNEDAHIEEYQTHFRKEGSEDSGIILDMNDPDDFARCYLKRTGRKAMSIDVDKNSNIQPSLKCPVKKHTDRVHGIDQKLEKIKDIIAEIKESDARLMQQFLYIHDGIEEIKWAKEYYEPSGSCESMAYTSREQLNESMDLLHEKWKKKRNIAGSRELLAVYESKVSLQNLLKGRTDRTSQSHYALGWYGKSKGRNTSFKNDLMHPEAYLDRKRRSSVGAMFQSEVNTAAVRHDRRKSSVGTINPNSSSYVSPTQLTVLETKFKEALAMNESSDSACISL